MKSHPFYAALVLGASLIVSPMAVAEPAPRADVPLANASQEARAKKLFTEIRCVVCQHESIVDSPAGIAADMRHLVRTQISAGATDADIQQDLVRRYGDYVLFRPPVKLGTLLLWCGPFALVLGAAIFFWYRSRRRVAVTQPLSEEEEAELALILAGEPDDAAKATLSDKNAI